jgi:hypothetical protein
MKASVLKKVLGQGKYSVKSVKSQDGHDGPGYLSSTVYKDGKRLGTMHEDTWGGGYMYDFDRDEVKELHEFSVNLLGEYYDDSLIQYLMQLALIEKRAKRGRKTKTVFLANENDEVVEYVYKYVYTAKLRDHILNTEDDVLKIYQFGA